MVIKSKHDGLEWLCRETVELLLLKMTQTLGLGQCVSLIAVRLVWMGSKGGTWVCGQRTWVESQLPDGVTLGTS